MKNIGLLRWLRGKESACNVGGTECRKFRLDPSSPGEGNGYPLQYSYLENPWTEKPGRLQSMVSQKSQTLLSDYITTNMQNI